MVHKNHKFKMSRTILSLVCKRALKAEGINAEQEVVAAVCLHTNDDIRRLVTILDLATKHGSTQKLTMERVIETSH
jgi:replication-associated recombination protein RarA